MESNDNIKEFTCNDCQEVSKVDWSKVRPDLDDGSSNIEICEKGNGYAYYGECMNCGNLVEIEPPVPELIYDNVEVDKDGIYIELLDKVTNRTCWIEAWKDSRTDEWDYDFNQYIFHLDSDIDIVSKMFQEELNDYVDDVYECVMYAIEEYEDEYNKLQENKAPTMRGRLKEAKVKQEESKKVTESDKVDYSKFTLTNKVLSGNKGLSQKEIDEMRWSLPKYFKDMTDEQKQIWTELSLRGMVMSCLVYGDDIHTATSVNAASKYYRRPYVDEYYDELGKDVTEEIIKQQTDYFNKGKVIRDVHTDSDGVTYNSFVEPEEESKKVTEAEDMTAVKNDVESAVEKSDSTDMQKDQVKGSLDVLKTDEESAIDGYEEFNKETAKVVDKPLADRIAEQMKEIVDDEKEHIEKLDTIKSALGESKKYGVYVTCGENGNYSSKLVDTVDSEEQAQDRVAELQAETGCGASYKELTESKLEEIENVDDTMQSNEFWVGDPCYVLSDDIYDNIWGKEYNYQDGLIDCGNGLSFEVHGTAYGDGCYEGSNGFMYCVDSGTIAVIPKELVVKEDGIDSGSLHKSTSGEIEYDNGVFRIEFDNEILEIDTDPSDEDDNLEESKKEEALLSDEEYNNIANEIIKGNSVKASDMDKFLHDIEDKKIREIKVKYNLDEQEASDLEEAISYYGYLSNEGVFFKTIEDLWDCFTDMEENPIETVTENTKKAFAEYIIEVDNIYTSMWDNEAVDRAREFLGESKKQADSLGKKEELFDGNLDINIDANDIASNNNLDLGDLGALAGLIASEEQKESEDKLEEAEETSKTATQELNTDLVPIINMFQYEIFNLLEGCVGVTREKIDEMMLDFAKPVIEEEIKDVLPSATVTFKDFTHPRYYRAFSNNNDVLNFDVTYNVSEYETLKEQAIQDPNFEKYLQEHYTSYDGFMSFFANNIKDFEEQEDWKQFVSVLSYYLPNDWENNQEDMYSYVFDHASDYDIIVADSEIESITEEINDKVSNGEMELNKDSVIKYIREIENGWLDEDDTEVIIDGVLEMLNLTESKKTDKKITESFLSREDIMQCYISEIMEIVYTYETSKAQEELDFKLDDLKSDKDLDKSDKEFIIKVIRPAILDKDLKLGDINFDKVEEDCTQAGSIQGPTTLFGSNNKDDEE